MALQLPAKFLQDIQGTNTNLKKDNRLIVLWGNRIAVATPSNNQNNQNQRIVERIQDL